MEESLESQRQQAKLDLFLQWLKVNGAELRACTIKSCGFNKGFGVFSTNDITDQRVLFVVPLDLAITPMRVLEDPTLGAKCRAMFEEGDVDDRLLVMLFLAVERLRKNSSWKPYLDMLPTTFGNPLWFTDDELLELKGTTLHRATELQKKRLQALFDDKVKHLVTELHFDGEFEREVCFEDFLWANSIFWTRALNIPFPHSYVFPQVLEEQENPSSSRNKDPLVKVSGESSSHGQGEKGRESHLGERRSSVANSTSTHEDTVWVEGLVPGIDFCNHDLKAAATWEVDGTGSATGVSVSMYLLSGRKFPFALSLGLLVMNIINIIFQFLLATTELQPLPGLELNQLFKNLELLYLYGFVIDDNPDDYLMVHYPMEALQHVPFTDSKSQLLEIQNAEMRCLLPKSSLDHGFFSGFPWKNDDRNKRPVGHFCNYSWSGQRKVPSYLNKLVFPDDFLTALRTIAMQEHELLQVSSMLEELVESREDKKPSDTDVRAAVWEVCGDPGALQLLVDLLSMKMVELEEGSGTEASDTKLLENAIVREIPDDVRNGMESLGKELMSRNRWSSIVYRRGQKQLTHLFLKEAEHALQLALSEEL